MNNEDDQVSLAFIADDIDAGIRSCYLCGQEIKDIRKARELGDTGVLIHAACQAPIAGPKPVLCPVCTHTVGSDAVTRQVGDMTASFHPLYARSFDAQVKHLASEMVSRQAPKPEQAVKKTLAKGDQASYDAVLLALKKALVRQGVRNGVFKAGNSEPLMVEGDRVMPGIAKSSFMAREYTDQNGSHWVLGQDGQYHEHRLT